MLPCKKLCPSCQFKIQEVIEKEDSEENNDECSGNGDDDDINDLEQIFSMYCTKNEVFYYGNYGYGHSYWRNP